MCRWTCERCGTSLRLPACSMGPSPWRVTHAFAESPARWVPAECEELMVLGIMAS